MCDFLSPELCPDAVVTDGGEIIGHVLGSPAKQPRGEDVLVWEGDYS